MDFHIHETIFEKNRKWHPHQFKDFKARDFNDWFYDAAKQQIDEPFIISEDKQTYRTNKWASTCDMLALESNWYFECRPYYKAYPAIVEALGKLRLDIPFENLSTEGLPTVLIRFAKGKEPCVSDFQINCILIDMNSSDFIDTVTQNKKRQSALAVFPTMQRLSDGRLFEATVFYAYPSIDRDGNIETIEAVIRRQRHIFSEDGTQLDIPANVLQWCFSVSFTVLLLSHDEAIVSPEVLSSDRDKYEKTGDKKYIEKARRRGVVGWSIGKRCETMPHYRRPHFGLRYTGKGGSIPKVVPVSGSIVHRSRLAEVPTGWITPDGREIE